jgi:hypothetical protein
MKGTQVAALLAALSVAGWQALPVRAQAEKTARGTVTAVSADSVSIKAGANDMKFSVDAQTKVTATGAGTKARKAEAAGTSGVKLTEVISVGKAVEVKYHETGGTMHAASIRAIASAGSAGGGVMEAAPSSKTADGTVKSVAAGSLVVSDGGKDMTFTVDAKTRVVGKGAGTKSAAAGGRTSITDLISNGDRVSVTYTEAGGAMHASTVRVTTKAATK